MHVQLPAWECPAAIAETSTFARPIPVQCVSASLQGRRAIAASRFPQAVLRYRSRLRATAEPAEGKERVNRGNRAYRVTPAR